jgi:tRNA(His) 5'-end guanylyltransferase
MHDYIANKLSSYFNSILTFKCDLPNSNNQLQSNQSQEKLCLSKSSQNHYITFPKCGISGLEWF